MNRTFIPEGQQRDPDPEKNPSVLANDVGMHFFETFAIPIVAGRAFDTSDTPVSRKVAVISEGLAKRYFPNVNPVGRTFEAGLNHPETIEIVGICGDAKYYRSCVRTSSPPSTRLVLAGGQRHPRGYICSFKQPGSPRTGALAARCNPSDRLNA